MRLIRLFVIVFIFVLITAFAANSSFAQQPASAASPARSQQNPSAETATQQQPQSPATVSAPRGKWPVPRESTLNLTKFTLASGETLPLMKLHYRTFGTLKYDKRGAPSNAILLLHSTSGSSGQFFNDRFAAQAFNPGQPFDAEKYFIIIPDSIGHGQSSKPSDGLKGKFPKYTYDDMVEAQRILLESLNIHHVRLIIGMSMGCMHAWVWAEKHPDFMDGVVPLACLPVEIAGRNRMWRKVAHDAIVKSPDYNGGDYAKQPSGLATAIGMLQLMGSNPVIRQTAMPSRELVDTSMERATDTTRAGVIDANDLAWALDSSRGYNPQPHLTKIKARVLAINFADDLINPPELGIFEREVAKIPNAKGVTIPMSSQTVGHGTHTSLLVYKSYLEEFLRELEK